MANKEGSLALLDMERGEQMGPAKAPWVAPKNTSAALAMALLDGDGAPAAPLSGPCPLPWADTSVAAAAAPPPVHAPIAMPGGSLFHRPCASRFMSVSHPQSKPQLSEELSWDLRSTEVLC